MLTTPSETERSTPGREPLDQLTYFRRLAQTAWENGQGAANAGDAAGARRWLERARRLAPQDPTIAFSLATLLLGLQDSQGEALFEELARAHDRPESWFGLAAMHLMAGRAEAAAAASSRALARNAPDPALADLLDRISHAVAAPGWCGLDSAGALTLGACPRPGAVKLLLDGRPVPLGPQRRLPRGWQSARTLAVELDGRPLLGSPLEPAAITRVEGFVEAKEGGLEGWAWLPGDAARDPEITVSGEGGAAIRLVARETGFEPPGGGAPFTQPRGFRVAPAAFAGLRAPLTVTGSNGRPLLGSPLDPGAAQRGAEAVALAVAQLFPSGPTPVAARPRAAAHAAVPARFRGSAPQDLPARQPPADIVIPVYRGLAATRACLASVLATIPAGTRVTVVDDASPEPALSAAMQGLARRGSIRLVRLPRNQGFPAAANAGMRASPKRDIVLLNSDTIVPPGWLERLRSAAYSAPDIGTVTPFSNDATILSYPRMGEANPPPDRAGTAALARIAARVNGETLVEIPTAIGFCMYIRRDCLDRVGLLREDVFAQGYGEENDFCLRARHLGWRHMAHTGAFVAHVGGGSFGAAKAHLLARNLAVLEDLHPGYGELVTTHAAADPLAPARRRMDIARWQAAKQAGSVILVTHGDGGGVRRRVAERCAEISAAGLRPIVLRPDKGRCALAEHPDPKQDRFPNLRFRLPDELPVLARLLAADRPHHVEIHHLLGHDHAVMELAARLGVPQDVVVHDYLWFCPRIALVGADRRYCGEPDLRACEACIADAGSNLEEEIGVRDLVARSAADLGQARRVIAPSPDAAARIRRHFPAIRPVAQAWEDDAALAPPPRVQLGALPPGLRRRVLIPGAIGAEKGYDVLIACARDAHARDLPLEFVVAGFTSDDERMLATGRVFITGAYTEAEAEAFMRRQGAALAFLPAIWPETWSYTLTQAWRAGLRVAAFDTGAPAERIRRTGWGWLMPLGLPASSINNALIGRAPLAEPITATHHREAAHANALTAPVLPA
jgi:GT2 family glycosyltransferase/glycosyltransferase involved in cell wall biosynthesis